MLQVLVISTDQAAMHECDLLKFEFNTRFSGSGFNQGINQQNSGNTTQAAGQPSTQQLRMLVQQIQMAVQAGYLNHQILNQPLAPTTLVLLNQLLAHIKVSIIL